MDSWNIPLPKQSTWLALGPPRRLHEGLKDRATAFDHLPFQRLPKAFYPKDRLINPPVFHYGYAISTQWLHDYAKDHNVLHIYPGAKSTDILLRRMDFCRTIDSVLDYIMEGMEITSFTLEYQLVQGPPCQRDRMHMLCITSNYRRRGKAESPTFDDVKKLKEFLGFDELPGWYLDIDNWGWGIRHPKSFAVNF